MKTKYIKINNLTDLSNFIKKAAQVKGDILVYRGKYCIDGKSIMGMLSIDTTERCKVEYPKEAIDFEKYLIQFQI